MSKRGGLPLPCWPLIPSRLAFKASASVMKESLPYRMQIQEMNLKVNGVFFPMISTLPFYCMTLFICTIKQIVFEKKKCLSKVITITVSQNTKNYFLFRCLYSSEYDHLLESVCVSKKHLSQVFIFPDYSSLHLRLSVAF